MTDKWYCEKCREEVVKAYPDGWWLLRYPMKPMSELVEDVGKPGYYLCSRHQKEVEA